MPGIEGGKLEVSREEPLKRELEDFVAAIRERRAPGVTGEQGRAALALAEQIVERMERVVTRSTSCSRRHPDAGHARRRSRAGRDRGLARSAISACTSSRAADLRARRASAGRGVGGASATRRPTSARRGAQPGARRRRTRPARDRVAAFSMADLAERAAAGGASSATLLTAAGRPPACSDVAELPVDRSTICRRVASHGRRSRAVARADGRRIRSAIATAEILESSPARASTSIGRHRARLRRCRAVRPVDKPTTGYEDVRMVALARLALGELEARRVRSKWTGSLYGPKLAQVALTFGADHPRRRAGHERRLARAAPRDGRGRRAQHSRGRLRAAGVFGPTRHESRSSRRRLVSQYQAARGRPRGAGRTCSRSASTCRRSAPRCCTRAASTSA